MALLADLLMSLLNNDGKTNTERNWPPGSDRLFARPPMEGEKSGKVVSPDVYMHNKDIGSDPNNIYDEQGNIIDYADKQKGGSSLQGLIEKLSTGGRGFKGEQGTLLGFLSRMLSPTPEAQVKGQVRGQGRVGGGEPGHVPGTGVDPALNPQPTEKQRVRGLQKVRDARVQPPLEPGNINLSTRPQVTNPDGSISTVLTKSFNIDGREVLLPTISDSGMPMTDKEAVQQFKETGKHLGVYANQESATAYAKIIHQQQESMRDYSQPTALDPQQIEELRLSLMTQAGQMDPNNPNGLAGRMSGPYSKLDQQQGMREAEDISNRVRGGYNSVSGSSPADFQSSIKNKLLGGE